MPPPNADETVMTIERAALSEEASRLAEAILVIRNIRERAAGEGRTFTDAERAALENLPVFAAIAKDGALLRYFINHELGDDEWERLRAAATKGSGEAVAEILRRYAEFRSRFDSWIANLDHEAVSALTDALEHVNDPAAFLRAQRISEEFVALLARKEQRTVED